MPPGITKLTPSELSLRASLASEASCVNTADRTARTQPGRDAMQRKFEAECAAAIGVDNWNQLTPAEQAKRVENARRLHHLRGLIASGILTGYRVPGGRHIRIKARDLDCLFQKITPRGD
jgi:hypothetical protein